jgi:hypothetical protein
LLLHAWARDSRYLSAADDRNYRAAQAWLLANTDRSDVLLVDNTVWIDLVERGYPRKNVVWFYKLDLDPAVQAQHRGGWQAMDYVVDSGIMGATQDKLPQTSAAIAHGHALAEFGDIRILRIDHGASN